MYTLHFVHWKPEDASEGIRRLEACRLVDYKGCSADETWPGLLFTLRKENDETQTL
ncbi:hypothetical protein JW935_09500 [candidate division KSB1 bacterium]|nr:hypothetical protein [candidate division KSB1 bacterium]